MKKWGITAGALALTLAVVSGLSTAADADGQKAIKNAMKAAMKGNLYKSVVSGKADKAQKEQLLALFRDMARAQPPRGDAASWKAKCDALVTAAQAAVDGQPGAGARLKSAGDCKACHSVHKGK